MCNYAELACECYVVCLLVLQLDPSHRAYVACILYAVVAPRVFGNVVSMH